MSTIVENDTPRSDAVRIGRFNLRAYLAGSAATVALIAAAVVVFGSLAAYVGFNGLPIGADQATDGSVTVPSRSSAPEDVASRLGGLAGAVAASPAAPTATAPGPAAAAIPGETTQPASAGDPAVGVPPPAPPPASSPSTTAQTSPAPASGSELQTGPVGGAVDTVDATTGGLGIAPVGDVADEVTGPVEGALGGALDGSSSGAGSGDAAGGLAGLLD